MNQRDINYYHGIALDWGLWRRAFRASQGMFPVPNYPGRPKKDKERHKPRRRPDLKGFTALQRANHKKAELPHAEPHSTRVCPSSRPLLAKIEYKLELIDPVIMSQPDGVLLVVCCMYYKGMGFDDTCRITALTSKQVGARRYKALKAIKEVLENGL